jgi:hypothetical protein
MVMNRADIEAGIKDMTVRNQTMAKIRQAGLPVPPKPEDSQQGRDLFAEWDSMKRKYGGIANIPFHELGDFLDRWTGMVAYARWTEAVADIDLTSASEIRDTIKDQLYTLQDGGRELRSASVSTEPLYREWEAKSVEASAMYKAVRGLRESYEQRLNSISREITRRGSDVLDGRRAMNRGQQS